MKFFTKKELVDDLPAAGFRVLFIGKRVALKGELNEAKLIAIDKKKV